MKFRFIFFVLSFSLLSVFLTSISFANQLSADCKESILSNLQKLYNQNVLNQTCYNSMVTKVNNFGSTGHVYTRYALIIGQGNINNYQGVLDTNRAIYIALSDDSHPQFINYPVATTNQIYNSWQVQSNGSGYKSLISGLLSTGSNPGGNQWQFNQLQSDLYCYAYRIDINTRTVTLQAGEEVGGNYLNTDLKYIDFNHNQVMIENHGYYNPQFNRSVTFWRLGTLSNISYHNDLPIYLRVYVLGSGSGDSLVYNQLIDSSSNSEEIYINNNYIYYNQGYKINFLYDNDKVTNNYFYYFTPYGIPAISGDSVINNDINNNNDISQNNFIGQLYNDLFVVSSGDVQEIYNLVESYFPSGETPISIYETIFGGLNNSPSDFIITWDSHPLSFTSNGNSLYSGDFISAGSINISKTVRENDVLRLIKFWVNTFVVIGFLLTYYKTLYNCWLHILGVVSEDVSDIVKDSDDYKRDNIGFKM